MDFDALIGIGGMLTKIYEACDYTDLNANLAIPLLQSTTRCRCTTSRVHLDYRLLGYKKPMAVYAYVVKILTDSNKETH